MSRKLKLTTLSEAVLKDKESKAILGGNGCTCSCYWEGTEKGASTKDDASADNAFCGLYRFVEDWKR